MRQSQVTRRQGQVEEANKGGRDRASEGDAWVVSVLYMCSASNRTFGIFVARVGYR